MTKLVSLSNEVYAELLKMKGKGESFSNVILSLTKQKKEREDIKRFAGALKGHKAELEEFKKMIAKDRKNNYGRKL